MVRPFFGSVLRVRPLAVVAALFGVVFVLALVLPEKQAHGAATWIGRVFGGLVIGLTPVYFGATLVSRRRAKQRERATGMYDAHAC